MNCDSLLVTLVESVKDLLLVVLGGGGGRVDEEEIGFRSRFTTVGLFTVGFSAHNFFDYYLIVDSGQAIIQRREPCLRTRGHF
eukprot:scaffold1174_cov281-Chaetoceros_neogracile.AAC.12